MFIICLFISVNFVYCLFYLFKGKTKRFLKFSMLVTCMQVPVYLSSDDYETLALNKPNGLTTPQFFALLLKNKAAEIRNTRYAPTID